MHVELVVASGIHHGMVIPIPFSQFLIGREPICNLRPAEVAVSKRHCALLVRGEQVLLRDLDSTNGTFLNGKRLQAQAVLRDNDCFRVGDLHFVVHLSKTAPACKVPVAVAAANDPESLAGDLLLGLSDPPVPPANPAAESLRMDLENTVREQRPAPKPQSPSRIEETAQAASTILNKYMRRPR